MVKPQKIAQYHVAFTIADAAAAALLALSRPVPTLLSLQGTQTFSERINKKYCAFFPTMPLDPISHGTGELHSQLVSLRSASQNLRGFWMSIWCLNYEYYY